MKNIGAIVLALVAIVLVATFATPAIVLATPPPVDGYEVFKVKMGGGTTDEITKKLEARGISINDYITQENFPLSDVAAASEEEVVVLVPVPEGTWLDEEGALELLKAAGLERPSYRTALRFAEQYGTTTSSATRPFIEFPHPGWQDPLTIERVIYVHRHPEDRRLHLDYINVGFGDDCMIAGVRRSEK